MKSHEFSFSPAALVRAVLPTPAVLVALIVLIKVSAHLQWLPPPAVAGSPDRTVLAHQALASRARHPAEVVFTGDSTCLMGIDAAAVPGFLPGGPRALNLSLVIGFSLDVYAGLISDFAASNPGQVRRVILLVSPSRISLGMPIPDGVESWRELHASPAGFREDPLALQTLRRQVFGHLLDTPLRGSGAEHFGFTSAVDAYMTAHDGSLVEFGTFRARRDEPPVSEWTLSPGLEDESRGFRARLPAGVALCIGLTPGPASTVSAAAHESRNELLRQWNEWVGADVLLTNLPVALPDALFSRTAHLNEAGQKQFTMIVGRELAGVFGKDDGE